MKYAHLIAGLLISVTQFSCTETENAPPEWEVVTVNESFTLKDTNGTEKTFHPSCAFDTSTHPEDGTEIDNAFHFFYKQGKSDQVVMFFNGGGACWNDATCVGSLALAQIPGQRPTYNPTIHSQNTPIDAGGIFDDENEENPFRDWSKVFIPYCTGDIHIGSNDVNYTDTTGAVTGFPGAEMTVKHRGFDNFMAVQEWMKDNIHSTSAPIKTLVVAGSSAGGYGATFNFPHIKSAFPESQVHLISDGSATVVTQGFIDEALSSQSHWKIANTLTSPILDRVDTFDAETINSDLIAALANTYTEAKFAQYTTEFDSVQIQFLKIMDQLDQGNTDPLGWALSPSDETYFYRWNQAMNASFNLSSESGLQYQHYIGEGSIHTVLTDAFATAQIPHPFYHESSAEGVKMTDWIEQFINAETFSQHSLNQAP